MINLKIINDFDNQIKLSYHLVEEIISNVIFNEITCSSINISIIICSDEYLRSLKIKYFDMDILTDVITFNLSENKKDLDAEIYISWERVCDNANIYKDRVNNEFKRVVIHGCLHLVGYQDSTKEEKVNMRKKEKEYMNSINEDVII